MTTPTIPLDQVATIAQRGQEAVATAVRTWTETVQRYATNFTPETAVSRAADVHGIADAYFDLSAQLLADQRELAAILVDTGTKTADAIAGHVRSFAAN
jgi:uncharacterized hydantoinase/oxoprolinase family protein